MSWWYEIKKAVQSRLTGDTTLTGLLSATNPIVDEIGTPETASMYPYLVRHWHDAAVDDTFSMSHFEQRFDVQARLGAKQSYGVSSSPMNRLDAILKRVVGDWEEQSSHSASYGLHRWSPGSLGSTGYTAVDCRLVGGPSTVQEDNVLGVAVTFAVNVYKAGA